MPTFYDSKGEPYVLNQTIGRGGEGTVFYCPNDLSLVAKIYHEPVTDEKAEKLRWMAANKNDGLLKIAAWIVDTLHDRPDGRIVGFLMPNVKAKEIHELYSLKSRRVHFPEATWQFLIHTAANVARAFYVLHKNDHIMGDVNHGNLVVLADGTVKLIDCDSYSIKTDKIRYTCEVGVATHLAPELQGIDLSEVKREKKHDNFGLAVIIFQLLFLGRHPFAGNYLGTEDKSLEDCIREHRFAYGNQQITSVKQPPGTLSLSQIPSRLAMMFTRAFMIENRPEPREWIEALEDLSNSLKTCVVHVGHHYSANLTECPWCRIESQTGLILFPFISSGNAIGESRFNIFTVENLVNQMIPAQNLPLQPSQFQFVVKSSPQALDCRSEKRYKIGKIALSQGFALVVLTFIFGGGWAFFFGIVATFIVAYIVNQQHSIIRDEFLNKFKASQQIWRDIETEWNRFNFSAEHFGDEISKIKRQINEHRHLQEEKAKQFKQLSNDAFQYQLKQYLSAFKLEDLKNPLIEKIHYDILNRYNLKTAADIEENRLQSLLALTQIKSELIQWRKDIESKFHFDSNEHLPVTAKNHLEIEYSDKRRDIELNIERMLGKLRSSSTYLQQTKAKLANNAEKSYREVVQAQRDLITIGGISSLVVLLVTLSIFVPIFSSVFKASMFGEQKKVQRTYTAPPPKVVPDYNVSTAPPVANAPVDFKVNENITDKQISEMPAIEREKSAVTLHKQAQNLIAAGDNKKAEKKLRLAVKFVDYNVDILCTLSRLLYDQNRYSESVEFLLKALIIDSENETVKLLLGANYLKTARNEEAEQIFLEVLERNPVSFEANFNLGGIYTKKGDYISAKYNFEKATEIEPDNVEAHYEYGVCLYKSGDWEGAKEQYEFLSIKDKKKAAQLWGIMTKNSPNNISISAG